MKAYGSISEAHNESFYCYGLADNVMGKPN